MPGFRISTLLPASAFQSVPVVLSNLPDFFLCRTFHCAAPVFFPFPVYFTDLFVSRPFCRNFIYAPSASSRRVSVKDFTTYLSVVSSIFFCFSLNSFFRTALPL